MVGMLKLCLLVCPSPDPASLRCGLLGSFTQTLMLRRRGSLLHEAAEGCCPSVAAVTLPLTN